jgi:hypothetical protein
MKRLALPVLTLGLLVATPLSAQEEPEPIPRGLTISSWICPQSAIQDIAETYDTRTRPIEEELVEEGLMAGAGLFFHLWGDEWNVNYYRLGADQQQIMDAIAEVGRRYVERYPELADEPSPFAACTAHKDGIYYWGPRTGVPSGS